MGRLSSTSRDLAALVAISFGALAIAAPVAAQTSPVDSDQNAATSLADIVVEGRDLREATRDFVGEVSAPVRRRGLARWHRGVCVGALSLQAEAARYLVDRVSTVAEDLGLDPGDPGCTPNVIIIGTDNGQAMARSLVQSRPREFDTGVSGANLGDRALEAFQTSDRLIRWWHVSLPVDVETGAPAVRIPGQCSGDCSDVTDFAPSFSRVTGSRLTSPIRDDLRQVIVILDIKALGQASFEQIVEYIAMVSLAQIDPDGETAGFNTILNLFDPAVATGRFLTDWDNAYLQGLYGIRQTRIGRSRIVRAVADSMEEQRRDPSGAD